MITITNPIGSGQISLNSRGWQDYDGMSTLLVGEYQAELFPIKETSDGYNWHWSVSGRYLIEDGYCHDEEEGRTITERILLREIAGLLEWIP